ncbi:MAG: hypothetical protein JSR41_03800 [Proteobacteria bacterium]|nr:hypothetical protein [Pseudomonadota bacterium]
MTLTLCGGLLAASAAAQSVVLVDASHARSPVLVYGTAATKIPAEPMRFVRLSAPLDQGTECCVRATGPQRPSVDFRVRLPRGPAAPAYATARLTGRHAPFIGIAFAGPAPKVTREDAHTLLLDSGPGRPARRLVHCLSDETLHVRLVDADSSQEQMHYALPLGMDVEADCDERLLPQRTTRN